MSNSGGTSNKPWTLKTPPGTSEYQAYRDESADPPALVVQVGKTLLRYHLRCIDDLHGMLKKHGDWMPLGGADEQKPAAEGTVEAWGRSTTNPVKGWYGLQCDEDRIVISTCLPGIETARARIIRSEAGRESFRPSIEIAGAIDRINQ